MHKPTCTECGATVEPGKLLGHVVAVHPKPTRPVVAERRVCRRKRCLELYGPVGHIPGAEGACAY